MYSKEWIKGSLKTVILKLLRDKKRLHGYQIRKEIHQLSQGSIQLTEGGLYPALHKMESSGLIKSEPEYQGKRLRKYYSLTSIGEIRAEESIEAYFQFVRTMILVLTPNAD
ncbi:MAG: PadR family transcriptional regulator [Cyclobacteriaceae bacterium]